MSDASLSIPFPPEALEAIARRAAELAAEKLGAGQSPWMDVAEAAAYLSWPKKRVYNLAAAKAIPHRKQDGRLVFNRDELAAWLDESREGPVPVTRLSNNGAS